MGWRSWSPCMNIRESRTSAVQDDISDRPSNIGARLSSIPLSGTCMTIKYRCAGLMVEKGWLRTVDAVQTFVVRGGQPLALAPAIVCVLVCMLSTLPPAHGGQQSADSVRLMLFCALGKRFLLAIILASQSCTNLLSCLPTMPGGKGRSSIRSKRRLLGSLNARNDS